VPLAKLTAVGSQDGNLTLLPEGGGTRAIVSFPVPGEQGAAYAVTFREGTCADPGAVAVEVPVDEDGVSQAVLDAGLDELRGQAFVIASADDGTALFCGDVPAA